MHFPDLELDLGGARMRVLETSDVHDGYVSGLNDPEVNQYLVNVKAMRQSRESVAAFVGSHREAPDAVLVGIWEEGRDHHAGTVRLHGIDRGAGTAEIGICLFDRGAWGKKLGSRAIAAVTKWARSELGVQRIKAGVYEPNAASRRAFEAAGYQWQRDIADEYKLEDAPVTVHIYTSVPTAPA